MKANGSSLNLNGTGAAYIRVSTDQQDTVRQYESIGAFEQRHGVTISDAYRFKDEGWARDTADHRPEFQRLIKLAEAGAVKWIVVDKLDRFGTKDPYQLVSYLHRLRECACRLFDVAGKEWTSADIATIITAVVEGEKSKGEQADKSYRVLSGKIARAKAGEWQGGPVRLGFDVVCYSRETGREVWRTVFEGKDKRLKVYPDGRTERFDGVGNFPQSQPLTEVTRVAPSRDKAKIAAAVNVFRRYATESVSFTVLARELNNLGFRNSFATKYHGQHVGRMLADPIYMGYYTWNRTHQGKFHRYAGGRAVPDENYEERVTHNDKSDWVQSRQLFEPLVDAKTWAAVQAKLDGRTIRAKAPTNPSLYLSGLIHCAGCGGRMVVGPKRKATQKRKGQTDGRFEYLCGTYQRYAAGRSRDDEPETCPCLRNGVFQDVLDTYIGRYLDDAGHRLELLTGGRDAPLTGRLELQEAQAWDEFCEGVDRLIRYLAKHHPDQYAALLKEDDARRREAGREIGDSRGNGALPNRKDAPPAAMLKKYGKKLEDAAAKAAKPDARPTAPDDFIADVLRRYRANFDPAGLATEITRLDAEHTKLTHRYADLPTRRAKDKATAELAALEARIEELERYREDAAGVVERHYRQMLDLQRSIAEAKIALQSDAGERALRQRAEAIRAVVQRIECAFTATGNTRGGPGGSKSRMVSVKVYPVYGEVVEFEAAAPAPDQVALPRTSVVFRW